MGVDEYILEHSAKVENKTIFQRIEAENKIKTLTDDVANGSGFVEKR
jgi:hypothetical protein